MLASLGLAIKWDTREMCFKPGVEGGYSCMHGEGGCMWWEEEEEDTTDFKQNKDATESLCVADNIHNLVERDEDSMEKNEVEEKNNDNINLKIKEEKGCQ